MCCKPAAHASTPSGLINKGIGQMCGCAIAGGQLFCNLWLQTLCHQITTRVARPATVDENTHKKVCLCVRAKIIMV